MTAGRIHGYTFGAVGRSPVSLGELEDLRSALSFTEADHDALRRLWEIVGDDLEALFDAWIGRIGHFFAPTFAGADGLVDDTYMAAAHPRFLKWIEDTCLRPYDQAWLDYQHEIGLRHHRTKKNEADGATAVEIVPYRYLPVTVAPMTLALREFIVARGVSRDDAGSIADAWMKALLLHVALWSRPYVNAADW